jgi:Na+/melibiose symporter-like transporter
MAIDTRTLLAYSLPAIPLAALTLPLYIIVPTFYSETLGLPLATVAAVLAAVRVFDAVHDPVIGWLADCWRPAFGRRRLFFLLSLPVTAIAAVMLFRPPAGAGAWWLGFWSAMLSVGYASTLMPYYAWAAELAPNYRERSRIVAFREFMTLIGTLIAIALPFSIGLSEQGGLAALGFAIAAALIVLGGAAVILVPEPREFSIARITLFEGIRRMAQNGPFVRLVAAFLLNGFSNAIPATLFLYFVSDRLGTPELRGPLLFLFFACGVAGIPLALWAAGRLGKHRAWCVAMLGSCFVFLFPPFVGQGDVIPFAIICVLTGIGVGFDLALPAAIQADVIDVDTAASGEQRSGIYFAAWSFTNKLALALGVSVTFAILAWFGFTPGGRNDETALFALAAVYAWLPVVLKLSAIALMWNFPLDEQAAARLRETIERRS